jgi:hypothetical protein
MALWTASKQNWTPVAVADATNFSDAGYLALQGGSTTQLIEVIEVYMGGLAASAAPAQMLFNVDHVVGASSLSGGQNKAMHPSTAALGAPPNVFSNSTTKPQRAAANPALVLPFNAQGGVVRWKVPRGATEGVWLLGNAADGGELSLSHAATGTPGLMGCHFIYEPL